MLRYNDSQDTVVDVKGAIYGFNRGSYQAMLFYV